MNVYFTSDTHFGHANIIQYCSRPFANLKKMDDELIQIWNDTVGYDDEVYHLGDFALCGPDFIQNYVRRLHGHIHLIRGNHDRRRIDLNGNHLGFFSVKDYDEIKIEGQRIVLCHCAFKTWPGSHKGSWNLHGHSHGSLPRDFQSKQLDVGVDVWGFRPLSFTDVAKEMSRHRFVPVDHHK